MIRSRLKTVIAENRRLAPLRLIAECSEKYLSAWYNENRWDFETNGEAFVLARFNQEAQGRKAVIWDVGAHYGEWSEVAHKLVPGAVIHSFEIIPEIAAGLTDRDWRRIHPFGLSNVAGNAEVHWNKGCNTNSSITPRFEHESFLGSPVDVIKCQVMAGDQLVGELGFPDFLKIDVEGHEANVLRGLRETLRNGNAPRLIQFEYGDTYVPSGSTLREIYSLLPGYSIGRLYPDHVDFQPYSYSAENLRMGNMIATRDRTLRRLLAG